MSTTLKVDIDVGQVLARCERTGSPFEKLSISPIN